MFDPDDSDDDLNDDDELDTDDNDDELTEEGLDETIACSIGEEPELASELEILRQYPTFLKAIARILRCTNMDLPEPRRTMRRHLHSLPRTYFRTYPQINYCPRMREMYCLFP